MASSLYQGHRVSQDPKAARALIGSVTPLTPAEMGSDGVKAAMKELDDGINEKISDHLRDEELLPELGDWPGID